jgi:putative LPS biosynthesis related polysaccharide transporter/flippase
MTNTTTMITNSRNKMLRNNILFSGFLKIVGLLTSLVIVPITINYLNNEVYGIWMTITSILYWITTFDIGLGNGMRNYLAEALATNDTKLGKKYISTTMLLLSLIALSMAIVLLYPLITINFNSFFNTNAIAGNELRMAVVIAVGFTLMNFVLKNIGMIFVAMQKYAINDLLSISGNVIALILIYILTKVTTGNLVLVVLAYTMTSCVAFLLAAIPLFWKHPELKPSLRFFEKSLGKKIVGKGFGFFVIQISSCLVIFGAANFFITQSCGPAAVTTYNIAYKFFNLLVIAYTIILAPMWNAYTDAYVKGDMQWIKATFNKALKFWVLSICGGLGMLLICNLFYKLWIGNMVNVPLSVSASTLIYVCFFNLNNCATYLINGLNKIFVQIIISLAVTTLYIITVLAFGRKLGVEGIVLSMAASYAVMSVVHLYQCQKLINGKADGIWNK